MCYLLVNKKTDLKKLKQNNTDTKQKSVKMRTCIRCQVTDIDTKFMNRRNVCRICHNIERREKYKNNNEYRSKAIASAVNRKKEIKKEKDKAKKEYQASIGIDNKKCRYCEQIKHKTKFRYNRLKCRDCERDEPKEKMKRYVRTRIYNCLLHRKSKSSIEYLGCGTADYQLWITTYNPELSLENYGKVWHIDHVIPISLFDLDDSAQCLLAFNWRNTMPLLAYDNLAKSNRIDKIQLRKHYFYLVKYHIENQIELPNKFVSLFATYLDAGNP